MKPGQFVKGDKDLLNTATNGTNNTKKQDAVMCSH